MTIEELVKLCQEQEKVLLIIPTKSNPKGRGVKLNGRNGPIGRICKVDQTEDGYTTVAYFDSKAILKFIKEAK